MILLKLVITSFILTMQKVNKNEKTLTDNLRRLNQMVSKWDQQNAVPTWLSHDHKGEY
jgi:hypothetical protein